MTQTALQYLTSIGLGGTQVSVLEDYEAVLARMRDAAFAISETDEKVGWIPPVELTACGEGGVPYKMAVAVHAIAYFCEIPPQFRTDVVE